MIAPPLTNTRMQDATSVDDCTLAEYKLYEQKQKGSAKPKRS